MTAGALVRLSSWTKHPGKLGIIIRILSEELDASQINYLEILSDGKLMLLLSFDVESIRENW